MANTPPSNKKRTTVAGVVIALLIGGYSLARQPINEGTGWNLPAVAGQLETKPTETPPATKPATTKPAARGPLADRMASAKTDNQPASKTPAAETPAAEMPAAEMPAAEEPAAEEPVAAGRKTASSKPIAPAADTPDDPSLKFGLLRELGNERYLSPSGLLYTPGSAEGHRLEHLRRHTEDQPSRPGKHGVFDGGMEGALQTIEQAYENAKAGKRTSERTDQGRTIYTVDMGKRVGYVGGREGNQRRKPMARRVQIVLDGNRVITAYPL